ncbi:MAG: DUF6600 domain-containing protein [Akkermansiaceae bacterium]
MKHSLPLTIFALPLLFSSCKPQGEETSRRIESLENERQELEARQAALEHELAEQKLAAEWEAIERERKRITEEQAAMAEASQLTLEQERQALASRTEELAKREAVAREQVETIASEQAKLATEGSLTKSELAIAGREPGIPKALPAPSAASVDEQFLRTSLSPYGTWYDSPEFGPVWQPAVCREPGWRPYTRGRWVCTDLGWTWVSSEPFGWATYHYGRWTYIAHLGWIWVPGKTWAPNWCVWRSNDRYIGWAPLPPHTLGYGYNHWNSFNAGTLSLPNSSYCFVSIFHFDQPIVGHCLPVSHNATCFSATINITRIKVVNKRVFCGGPGYHDLSKKLGRKPPYCRIEDNKHSYHRPQPVQLRNRIKGDRLLVAAPAIKKRPTFKTGRPLERIARAEPVNRAPTKPTQPERITRPVQPAIATNPPLESHHRTDLSGRPEKLSAKKTQPEKPAPPAIALKNKQDEQVAQARAKELARQAQLAENARNRQADLARRQRMAAAASERAEQKKKQEEQARLHREKLAREEAAEARRRQEEEEEEARERQARLKAEAARQQREAMKRRQAEEALQKKRAEAREAAEAQQKAREAANRKKQQEDMQRRQREAAERREREETKQRAEEAAERQKQREEMARRQREEAKKAEEGRRQREEEQRKAAERQRQREEAERRQREEAKQRAEEARRRQEEADRKRDEERQRQREEAQRQAEERSQQRQEEQQRERQRRQH